MSDTFEVAPFGATLASIDQSSPMPVAIAMSRPTLLTALYTPRGEDRQQPHEQDEVYMVAAGIATLEVDDDGARSLEPGDAAFVAAHAVHRFVDMSDFAGWAAFPQ